MKLFKLRVHLKVQGTTDIIVNAETEEEAIAKMWADCLWEQVYDNPSSFVMTDIDPKDIDEATFIDEQ